MNRRRSNRFPFSSRLALRRDAGQELTEVRAFDVSVGGFGFSMPSSEPLSIGEVIFVSLVEVSRARESGKAAEDLPLEVPAVVRYVSQASDGVWRIGAERHL